ncbi:MAG: DUF6049 family protein [Acidimicrobiia bacterium]
MTGQARGLRLALTRSTGHGPGAQARGAPVTVQARGLRPRSPSSPGSLALTRSTGHGPGAQARGAPVTAPPTRRRAGRPAPRRPTAAVCGALAALSLTLSVAGVPGAAGAAPRQPRPPTAARLELVGQTPFVPADGDLEIRLRVRGAPAGAVIRTDVHPRVTTRSELQLALKGRSLRARAGSPPDVPAPPGPTTAATVRVPTRDQGDDPERLLVNHSGVYPVALRLVSAEGAVLDSLITAMIRLPAATDAPSLPLGVAVVVPITGPPVAADGSVPNSALSGRALTDLAQVLNAHPGVAASIAPTPALLDALATGTTSTLAPLRTAGQGREVLSAPYVPVEVPAWLEEGMVDEVATHISRGVATTAARIADPAAIWRADDRLDGRSAGFLRDLGIDRLIIPEGALSALDEDLFRFALTQPFAVAGVGGVRAMAADTALAAHENDTGDPVLDAHHLLADLATLFFDDPSGTTRRGVVVQLGNEGPTDPRYLDAVLSSLAPSATARPILDDSTVGQIFDDVPLAGSRGERDGSGRRLERTLEPEPSASLGPYAGAYRRAAADLGTYRSVVDGDDNPLVEDLERTLLNAAAPALGARSRQEYLDRVRQAAASELEKIGPPARQTIRFTAREGVVALTLTSGTGYPVDVVARLAADKLQFPDHPDGSVPLRLTGPTTRVELRVRTLASGDSPLELTLVTPDGRTVLGRTQVTVRSTAFSGLGIVLSAGSAGFLVLWWGRHALTTRRLRRHTLRHAAGPRRRHARAPSGGPADETRRPSPRRRRGQRGGTRASRSGAVTAGRDRDQASPR